MKFSANRAPEQQRETTFS